MDSVIAHTLEPNTIWICSTYGYRYKHHPSRTSQEVLWGHRETLYERRYRVPECKRTPLRVLTFLQQASLNQAVWGQRQWASDTETRPGSRGKLGSPPG